MLPLPVASSTVPAPVPDICTAAKVASAATSILALTPAGSVTVLLKDAARSAAEFATTKADGGISIWAPPESGPL